MSPLVFGAVVGAVFATLRMWRSLVGTAVTTVLLVGTAFLLIGALSVRDPNADEVRWWVGWTLATLTPIAIGIVLDRRRAARERR